MKRSLLLLGLLPILSLGVTKYNNAPSFRNVDVKRAEAVPGWTFDASTDVMIDDFYNENTKRVLGENAIDSGYSFAEINVAASTTADEALYKYASAIEKNQSTLTFSMKIDETVDLSKIKMNVRGGGTGTEDKWSVKEVPLLETINADGEVNTSIEKGKWIDLTVSIPNTWSGATYPTTGDTATSVLGFTLFNTDETNKGLISLKSVKLDENVIDDFNRKDGIPANCYWVGFAGTINERHVTLNNGGTYTFKNTDVLSKANPVIRVKGDLSGLSLALVNKDGTIGEYKSFESLKDFNNAQLPSTSENFIDLAIHLENSGFTGEFAGVSVKSTKEVILNKFYVSDLITRTKEVLLPTLDLENAVYYNDFNITQEGGKWNKEYGEAPQALQEHGIKYATTYTNTQDIKFDGNNLVLPKITDDYANFFIGTSKDIVAKDYFVVSLKADAKDVESLRFKWYDGQPNDALWLHAAYAGYGLPTSTALSHNYEYVEDGYTWLVYDLNESGIDKSKIKGELNMYWGAGSGDILIDKMFYADALNKEDLPRTDLLPSGDLNKEINPSGYVYQDGGFVEAKTKYYELTIKALEDNASLQSFRLEQEGGKTSWLKDDALIGVDGEPLKAINLKKDETQTIIIDLEKSGYDVNASKNFHAHFGALEGAPTGKFVISSLKVSTPHAIKVIESELLLNEVKGAAATSYAYLGGVDIKKSVPGEYLKLEIESPSEIKDAFKTTRIEFVGSGNRRFEENEKDGTLYGRDGNKLSLDLKEGKNTIVIDLVKSGIDARKLTNMHFQDGGAGGVEKPQLKVTDISFLRNSAMPFTQGIPEPDYEKPTLTLKTDKKEYVEGDKVKLTIDATDNLTAKENIAIDVKVTEGTGDSIRELEVKDNEFVADKKGTYTITVTATDEAGMSTTVVQEITVKAKEVTPDPDPTPDPDKDPDKDPGDVPEEPKGLGAGAIAGIAIGAIAGVGLLGGLIYYFLKKRK